MFSEAVIVGWSVTAICVINVYLPFSCSLFASFSADCSEPAFEFREEVSVAQTAAVTCLGNWSTLERPSGRVTLMPGESFQSLVVTVIQQASSCVCVCVACGEVETISTVRGVDGTSREYERPRGVVDSFQVSEYSVEPIKPNRCRNLLSKERSGPSGTDEPKKVGP